MKIWTLFACALAVAFAAYVFAEDSEKEAPPKEDKPAAEAAGKKAETDESGAEDGDEKEDEFPVYSAEITGSRVSVRSGPNAGYARLMRAAKGSTVTVIGEEGEWARILVPAQRLLWVHERYVNVDAETKEGTVNADKVNIRINPDPDADVVGQLSKGMIVEVTGGEDEWVEIKPPSTACAYVHKNYLKRIEPEE